MEQAREADRKRSEHATGTASPHAAIAGVCSLSSVSPGQQASQSLRKFTTNLSSFFPNQPSTI
ncbi:hypothetical protein COCNU_01G014900 [Cocos nucifera]|uniref:Uncharacterized protein n=1 Tax=Cocos nucifera TaxID=13894 RepID=A0A8K0HVV5_COCNU|nr:hypothetical protein COCNU_01G014900 [Cocos nucifera]